MPSRPHVFQFLTHDELKLCFCVAFTTMSEECRGVYAIDRYATPGEEKGTTNEWTELVLRAVRYLSFEHGMRFEGIVAHRDGRVTAERPICDGNELYVALFKAGGFPDFDVLLPAALRVAPTKAPTLNLEPMRSVLADLKAEIAERVAAVDPNEMAEVRRLRGSVLRDTYHKLRRVNGQPVH